MLTRAELKTAFEFIDETLTNIYTDVAYLGVETTFTPDELDTQKRALRNILILATFTYDTIKRLDSKEGMVEQICH